MTPKTRYRFGEFTLSPGRRLLLRSGHELPLIPRYLDLLILLVERRHEAVHRREILESAWSDVVVSDGALSQAIRTLRRALGDDFKDPIFIRTVSRHGYRFVFPDVIEETDDPPVVAPKAPENSLPNAARFETALSRLLDPGAETERREAAETLHALGTEEVLKRLDERPRNPMARALLRDTRWDVPGAGPVPLLGQKDAMAAICSLAVVRLRRAARLAGGRWASAAMGGGLAGASAGLIGGAILLLAGDPPAPPSLPLALALIGSLIGAVGAAGVGAGLATAEALARSYRGLALVICGAAGGGAVGLVAHLLGRWTLEDLFGSDLSAVGGGVEGVVIGFAAGVGYALATPRPDGGMAAPRGRARWVAALVTGACCAAACIALTWAGRNLGGVSLDYMAKSFKGSQVGLAPLARLLGEPDVGPITRTVLSAYEGMLFGSGLVLGLTRRPKSPG